MVGLEGEGASSLYFFPMGWPSVLGEVGVNVRNRTANQLFSGVAQGADGSIVDIEDLASGIDPKYGIDSPIDAELR